MKFIKSIYTDIGTEKKINQDSLFIMKARSHCGPVLFAGLCDGAGGLNSGEMASSFMVSSLQKWFRTALPAFLSDGEWMESVQKDLVSCIQENSDKILEYGESMNMKIGTTLTCLLIVDGAYLCVHVGDSRLYLLDDSLHQLTTDHSYVNVLVEKNMLTAEEAKTDHRRNILMQCVGASRKLNPQVISGMVQKNDVFLICCDGFYHELSEDEIYIALNSDTMTSDSHGVEQLKYLFELVKSRGETDNISALAVKVGE